MQIVDITDVRKIEFDSNSFNTIKEGDSLKLFSNVNGSIIDNNFLSIILLLLFRYKQ